MTVVGKTVGPLGIQDRNSLNIFREGLVDSSRSRREDGKLGGKKKRE